MTEIEIRKRSGDWHAQIKGQPGLWGCGKTPDEAVGSMARNHAERLGLDIQFVPSRLMAAVEPWYGHDYADNDGD